MVFQTFDAPHIGNKVFAAIALYLAPFFVRQVYNLIYANPSFLLIMEGEAYASPDKEGACALQ